MEEGRLYHGPLGDSCAHLCVDMQNLFVNTEWHTPWMERVLPVVERIARAKPDKTIFTRFIPAERPGEGEYCFGVGTCSPQDWRWSSNNHHQNSCYLA